MINGIAKKHGLDVQERGGKIEIINPLSLWRSAFEKECREKGIKLNYTTERGGKDYYVSAVATA